MSSFTKGLNYNSAGSKFNVVDGYVKVHEHEKSLGGAMIKKVQNKHINQCYHDSIVKVNPATSLASDCINNGTFTDYRLPRPNMTLEKLSFHFTIANGSSTAGTEQQQTIDFEQEAGVIADGGSVFFEYKGEQSDEVAWNATEATFAANCLTALNAMATVIADGSLNTLAVTSGDWATQTDVLLTATWSQTGVKDLIICHSSLTDGGILLNPPASTVTVAGVEGGLTTNAFAPVRQFEFISSGGSEMIVVRSDDLYLYNAFYNADEWQRHRRAQNLTAAYANDEKIELSGSKNFQIDIPNPFSEGKFFMGRLKEDITIRVQWANSDWNSTGTASDGSISNAYFLMAGYVYDPAQTQYFLTNYNKNISSRFLKSYVQSFSQTYSSATEYTHTLNSLNIGEVSYLHVLLRLSTGKNENQISPEKLSSIQLLDAEGHEVSVAQSDTQNRYLLDGSHFPGSLTANKYVYSFVFGDPSHSRDGLSQGFYSFNGNEQLKINTGTLGSSGSTYTLSVHAYAPALLSLDGNGYVKVNN